MCIIYVLTIIFVRLSGLGRRYVMLRIIILHYFNITFCSFNFDVSCMNNIFEREPNLSQSVGIQERAQHINGPPNRIAKVAVIVSPVLSLEVTTRLSFFDLLPRAILFHRSPVDHHDRSQP